MNVQELIDHLLTVEDKTKTVSMVLETGMGCFSKCDDVSFSGVSDETGEVIIEGYETSSNE